MVKKLTNGQVKMELHINWYKYIRLLSLDVATGACICAGFFARYTGLQISLSLYLALFMTVFLIYTVDHLLDAFSVGKNANIERHLWHHENAHSLWPLCVVISGSLAILTFSLPAEIIKYGMHLAGLVIIYFVISQTKKIKKIIPKEAIIAALYSAGVFLPIYALQTYFSIELMCLAFLFFLLSYANLIIISLIEFESDKSQNMVSIATQFGKKTTSLIIHAVFLGMLVVLTVSVILFQNVGNFIDYAEVLLLMGALMYLVYWKRQYLIPEELYRVLGDTVFLLPAFFMWLSDFQ
jgi:hypothetical protein